MNMPIKTKSTDSKTTKNRNAFRSNEVSTGTIGRSLYGGCLMGLANLVPGISGGTMLLVAGIYPRFIAALADITQFRFRIPSLTILICVALAGGMSILLGAGLIKDLVVHHRWIMYSLFIGLTLGGIPLVWRMARPASFSLILPALLAFSAMVVLVILQTNNVVGSNESGLGILFLAGLAGAGAMILPGLSGGYILLLLGQYVPILSAIDQFKDAIKSQDIAAAMDPALTVLLPVGIGLVVGIIIIGNLLQWLLKHYPKPTLGLLLGLLVGSVAGLYPFQTGVTPQVGDQVKGQVVTQQDIDSKRIDQEDWPVTYFRPQVSQAGLSIVMIALGLGITLAVAKIGSARSSKTSGVAP